MLSSLHIENMAVIARMDVDFAGGLSAVTGETGAGKSVMIDALAFLLGGKANRELLRHGCDQGLVSAVFSDIGEEGLRFLSDSGFHPDGEVMLQRTLSADGRTQCRIDGRVIPLTILREFSKYLVSIHGQNDNQLLLFPAAQEKYSLKWPMIPRPQCGTVRSTKNTAPKKRDLRNCKMTAPPKNGCGICWLFR